MKRIVVQCVRMAPAHGPLAKYIEPYLAEAAITLVKIAVSPKQTRPTRRAAWNAPERHHIVVQGPDGVIWN